MTLLASNDSSFGVAAAHMDVEQAQNQVRLAGHAQLLSSAGHCCAHAEHGLTEACYC